jgi:hypothetical protein
VAVVLSLDVGIDNIFDFLLPVVCEEIADIEGLQFTSPFDERPNFDGFVPDITAPVNSY